MGDEPEFEGQSKTQLGNPKFRKILDPVIGAMPPLCEGAAEWMPSRGVLWATSSDVLGFLSMRSSICSCINDMTGK